jgi:hypothetical protein
MAGYTQGPLSIEGFRFTKALGTFSIGDSYVYTQDDNQQLVHVLLSRTPQSLDGFIAEFSRLIGDESAEIVLFAGSTDRGRPYLVTDFLDEQPTATTPATTPASTNADAAADATAPAPAAVGSESADIQELADETRISSRSQELDQTRLSAVRSPLDETVISSRTSPTRAASPITPRSSPSAAKRISIPTLVVTERQAFIPNPLTPADDASYSPRDVPDDGERQTLQAQPQSVRAVAPRPNRRARERKRARSALLAVAVSVLASVLGATALLWWLIAK